MARLAEELKNRAESEPPTFKPEFLLQGSQGLPFTIRLDPKDVSVLLVGGHVEVSILPLLLQGTVSFVADFFLALIEWPVIGMTKESSGSLNFIASTLNRVERLTVVPVVVIKTVTKSDQNKFRVSFRADVGDKNVPKEVVSNNLTSFASLVCDGGGIRTVIQSLDRGKPTHVKVDVQIPLSSILEALSRFGFSLYGYFTGKKITFLVVENYVRNAWKKYGIKCTPIANLLKQDLNSVPIWVKLRDIPIVAFTEDGLSVMATKLGTPLREGMIIVIPNVDDDDGEQSKNTNGFQYPPKRASHGLNLGFKVQFKPLKQVYQPVIKKNGASSSGTKKQAMTERQVASTSNLFDTLNTVENDDELGSNGGTSSTTRKSGINNESLHRYSVIKSL
ncbi:hypothetical protein Tco_1371044 [Tanacetum coccineum]